MTNSERINNMSVEEKAKWIYWHINACAQCPECIRCRKGVRSGELNPSPCSCECCNRIANGLNEEAKE